MVELIKEVSPKSEAQKRREAYANPYEELSPVPVKPVIRHTRWKRKVGETEKPEEKSGAKKLQKEKEKEKEVEKEAPQMPLSPQRIIEATVPKVCRVCQSRTAGSQMLMPWDPVGCKTLPTSTWFRESETERITGSSP